jgi:hypothetical protein
LKQISKVYKQEHEVCKYKCKQILIVIKYENVNTKETKQNYETRLYLKLMLNKLNVMRGFTFIYTPLIPCGKASMMISICPPTKELFWKPF